MMSNSRPSEKQRDELFRCATKLHKNNGSQSEYEYAQEFERYVRNESYKGNQFRPL